MSCEIHFQTDFRFFRDAPLLVRKARFAVSDCRWIAGVRIGPIIQIEADLIDPLATYTKACKDAEKI